VLQNISKNLASESKLTPGSVFTFKTGGWFELFEATFDLFPGKRNA
jgi:hypothetical protein